MHPQATGTNRAAQIAICAVGVILNIAVACNLFLPDAWAGRNDFLGFYAGARLVGSGHLYSRESVKDVHLDAIGETGEIQYGRLPVYALALKPLGWMRYRAAYICWAVMMVAAFAGFAVLWPGDPTSKWFICCWSLPAWISLLKGQDDLILLFLVALAAHLLHAGKPLAAGMVLVFFAASKFHLFTMVPLVLLAQRRWRMFLGSVIGGCSLLAISFAAEGTQWPFGLYALVTDSRVSTGLDHMPNLHSLLVNAPFSLALQIGASLVLAGAVYLAARNSDSFEYAIGVALAGGVLVGYHGYVHDGSLFLPALIAFSSAGAAYARTPAMLLITPIPWCVLQFAKPFPGVVQLLLLGFVLGGVAWLRRGDAEDGMQASPNAFSRAGSVPAA